MEVVHAFAANLEGFALPQQGMRLRGVARRGAQRGLVAHDDRQSGIRKGAAGSREGERGDAACEPRAHRSFSFSIRFPRRDAVITPSPGGAMMTCTLSESFSARIFWIRTANAGLLLRLGLELALLDLALLEGEDVLHRFLLPLGGDHLLPRGRLGELLAARLLGLAVERHLFHALVFQLQRVAHLLARELLGQELVHAATVFGGQVDITDEHVTQGDAVRAQAGLQLFFYRLLDLDALGREDLAHGVAREHLVNDAGDGGLHDLRIDVLGQLRRHLAQARRIDRIAHREIHAERKPLEGLQRGGPRRLGDVRGPIGLVANGVDAHFVQERNHDHAAVAPLRGLAGKAVFPHARFAVADGSHGWIAVDGVGDDAARDEQDDYPTGGGEVGKRSPDRSDQGLKARKHRRAPLVESRPEKADSSLQPGERPRRCVANESAATNCGEPLTIPTAGRAPRCRGASTRATRAPAGQRGTRGKRTWPR